MLAQYHILYSAYDTKVVSCFNSLGSSISMNLIFLSPEVIILKDSYSRISLSNSQISCKNTPATFFRCDSTQKSSSSLFTDLSLLVLSCPNHHLNLLSLMLFHFHLCKTKAAPLLRLPDFSGGFTQFCGGYPIDLSQ